jgi:hypothetical protein
VSTLKELAAMYMNLCGGKGGGRDKGHGRGIEGESPLSKEAGVKERVLGVYRVVLSAPYC